MSPRSIRAAATAASGLALFYVVVVWVAPGSFAHLVDQAGRDWYFLIAIVGAFGVQVALVSELRRRHRLQQPFQWPAAPSWARRRQE